MGIGPFDSNIISLNLMQELLLWYHIENKFIMYIMRDARISYVNRCDACTLSKVKCRISFLLEVI